MSASFATTNDPDWRWRLDFGKGIRIPTGVGGDGFGDHGVGHVDLSGTIDEEEFVFAGFQFNTTLEPDGGEATEVFGSSGYIDVDHLIGRWGRGVDAGSNPWDEEKLGDA